MISISGTVIRGKGEARTIGYPTANIDYTSSIHPEAGVWTCWAEIAGKEYQGLAVVGMWVLPHGLPSIEIHFFNMEQDLYGTTLQVTLLDTLRALISFTSTDALVAQIEKDIIDARRLFAA